MAAATSFASDYHWISTGSRRNSIESVLSIQGRETDIVRDTSDTDGLEEESGAEFEPVTEPEDDDGPVNQDSSGESDNDIIKTRIIEVCLRDDGDLVLADSEQTSSGSDSELDLHDYWRCAQCSARNNNPLYRYCERCFKVRKNFFPPRPKRKSCKQSRDVTHTDVLVHTLSQADSGVGTDATSQELPSSQDSNLPAPSQPFRLQLKRRAESATDSDSDQTDIERTVRRKRCRKDVAPLVKTVSDPSLTIDDFVVDSKENNSDNLCIICFSEPKSGVFVHGRIAHICCCYKCAVKVWSKAKRCPICNCKVSNVLKAVVM